MKLYCVHRWHNDWAGECPGGLGGTWKCKICGPNWAGYGLPPKDYLPVVIAQTADEFDGGQ